MNKKKTILVLGAYGLIGSDIFRALEAEGFHVVGLGRNPKTAQKVLGGRDWRFADISTLVTPEAWGEYLDQIDCVVNCSGALQSHVKGHIEALHHHAVDALAQACGQSKIRLIQISAVGATPTAETEFLASKGRGDAAIRQAMDAYVIIRPGLVLCHTSYGGTQLLRMLASVPYVQPIANGNAQIQTIGIKDINRAVIQAVNGKYKTLKEFDLLEQTSHSLQDVVIAHRDWLGFGADVPVFNMPNFLLKPISVFADFFGRLGWRSPLRSTAMQVMNQGVTGTHDRRALSKTHSMYETLSSMPAGAEHRMSARMSLMMPIVVAMLSVFWIASGVIGALRFPTAAEVLTNVGWPYWLSALSVLFWAVVDVVLGCTVLIRKHSRTACLAMIAVCVVYLVFSTIFVPALWADPLGPLVKVIPAIGLAWIARILLETR